MALFTGAYTDPLDQSAHPTMQTALDVAQQALAVTGATTVNDLALIVVALTGSGGANSHPWAGLRVNEEHYSGSLVKIAAMHAAFDLRASADVLATEEGLTTWPEIEAALRASFDAEVTAHTPAQISGAPLLRPQDKTRMPDYAAVLELGSGPAFTVDFTAGQLAAFEDMMVHQNNPGATTTIHGLGYPYLNGKLADDDFFDGAAHGLWLAGDYAGQWPAARVACVNDVDTAQGATVWHVAKLMALLADGRLVGPLSSEGMRDLMGRAGKFFHGSPPIWPSDGRFQATHGKVGIGPLKNGRQVFSEATLVRDTARDVDFAVVWQNAVLKPGLTQRQLLESVATLIEATIAAFI